MVAAVAAAATVAYVGGCCAAPNDDDILASIRCALIGLIGLSVEGERTNAYKLSFSHAKTFAFAVSQALIYSECISFHSQNAFPETGILEFAL